MERVLARAKMEKTGLGGCYRGVQSLAKSSNWEDGGSVPGAGLKSTQGARKSRAALLRNYESAEQRTRHTHTQTAW